MLGGGAAGAVFPWMQERLRKTCSSTSQYMKTLASRLDSQKWSRHHNVRALSLIRIVD